jgi:hypothetical protein
MKEEGRRKKTISFGACEVFRQPKRAKLWASLFFTVNPNRGIAKN